MPHFLRLLPNILRSIGCLTALLLICDTGMHIVGNSKPVLDDKLLVDWILLPDYQLPGKAVTMPVLESPRQRRASHVPLPKLEIHQQPITDAWEPAFDTRVMTSGSFSTELWIVDHSNIPVGTGLALRDPQTGRPIWTLWYWYRGVWFETYDSSGRSTQRVGRETEWRSGFNQYWRHLVLSVDQGQATIYLNGDRVGQVPLAKGQHDQPLRLELIAATEHEPLMRLENLLYRTRIHGSPMTKEQVHDRFEEMGQLVDRGLLDPGRPHFNARPIITHVRPDSATLVFETDRLSTAEVLIGTSLPLNRKVEIKQPGKIHQVTLDQLEPQTTYLYQVIATAEGGTKLMTEPATVRTASPPGQPVRFAVMGDTESRPHVNARVAELIWGHRPHFVVHTGDVTDGGKRPYKNEWNQEFFLGNQHLHARIPIFAVPGNGEDDLHWYKQYLPCPLDQDNDPGFYHFRYGDAQFFMLDTNRRGTDFAPGGRQFEWLRDKLEKSSARWKIVCHHHPHYSSSCDDYGNSWEGQTQVYGDHEVRGIAPLLDQYQVDVVFNGHIHLYERTHPIRDGKLADKGTLYVTTGGAGGNLEDLAPTPPWFSAFASSEYHYLIADLETDRLELRMYDIKGALRDSISLTK